MRSDLHLTIPGDAVPSAPALLLEYLDTTRSSLWVVDPHRLHRLRACLDEARRWGELDALAQFWREHRVAEDAAVELDWFDAAPGAPLTPEPPFVLACACTGELLEATQQHAALPLARGAGIAPLFDPARPGCHRWLERDLDLAWHAAFLPARAVLQQLPARIDQSSRAALTDWLFERARAEGAAPSPREAATLFEAWSRHYAERWRAQVAAELEPLAARDAQLVVFTDD